jgi:hypothetical protein
MIFYKLFKELNRKRIKRKRIKEEKSFSEKSKIRNPNRKLNIKRVGIKN